MADCAIPRTGARAVSRAARRPGSAEQAMRMAAGGVGLLSAARIVASLGGMAEAASACPSTDAAAGDAPPTLCSSWKALLHDELRRLWFRSSWQRYWDSVPHGSC